MKKWFIVVLIVIIAVTIGIAYKKSSYTKKTVNLKAVKQKQVKSIFGIGEVSAKNIYKVGSQMGGKVLKIFTDTGKYVKKGDLIATIDMVDLPQQLAQNEALLKKSVFEIKVSEQALQTLQPKLKLYEITFNRYSKLYKKGYAAKVEYDNAKSNLDTTLSQIQEAKIKIKSAKEEKHRINKLILSTKEKMARYKIYSPVAGYVITRNVNDKEDVTPAQAIVEIVNPGDVWIRAYIDESLSGKVKKGQKALIVLRSQPSKKIRGFVERVEPVSDKITEERVVDVKFLKIPEPFYINEQAEVYIDADKK